MDLCFLRCILHDKKKKIFSHWIEPFHRNRFFIDETFVYGPKASLSQSAPAIGHGAIIKVACDLHQLMVKETRKT